MIIASSKPSWHEASDLIAVEVGQADVEQHHTRTVGPRGLHHETPVEDDLNLVPQEPEEPGQACRQVLVVIHDQDAVLVGVIHLI